MDYILVGKGFALAVGGAFAGGLVVAVAAASPVGGVALASKLEQEEDQER